MSTVAGLRTRNKERERKERKSERKRGVHPENAVSAGGDTGTAM
jgi:hypothetical protein